MPNAGGFLGVKVIESEPAGVFVGSDGDAFGGVAHGRFAFFPSPAPGIEVRKLTATPWVIAPGQSVTFNFRVENTYGDRPVTLTSLVDTSLGDLNGAGTCTLPQTIPAYGTYTCSVAQQINAAPLVDVTATVTATANNGTGNVTSSDTSDIQGESSEPTFRLRLASGPWTVQYPSGPVQFAASFLNIDARNPITVTSLTSPQYGDLSSSCNLPVVVQPSKIVSCHLTLTVGGSVGSAPSFSFSAKATTAIGQVTSNGSASITITPPPSGIPLLYIVGNAAALTSPEAAMRTRLMKTYNVTTIDDDNLTPADTVNQGLIVVQGSALESKIGLLKTLASPVMVLRNRMLDELGMSTVAGQGQATLTTGTMVTTMHPLAAALNGAITINSGTGKVGYWAVPGANAATSSRSRPRPSPSSSRTSRAP